MKRFFIKKYIFAALFLIVIFAGGIVNGIYEFEAVKDVFHKYGHITNKEDLNKFVARMETGMNDSMLGKMQFIEGYGYIQKILGKSEINNFSYVKDKNGYLHYSGFYRESDKNISEYAKRVRRLQESVKSKGTKVIFVSPPGKYMSDFSEFDQGFPVNKGSKERDELLIALHENGVQTLDLQNSMMQSGLSYDDMFFKTDHHWKPQAAFYSFTQLVETLDRKFGMQLDPENYYTDINNYHIREYQQCMLGSMGANTGINYAGLDDFTFIWPKCDMEFKWEAEDQKGVPRGGEGKIENSLLQLKFLVTDDPYNNQQYSVYLNGVSPVDHIENKSNETGLKVLCIRDSFFSPVALFLAPMFREMDMVWPLASYNKKDVESFLNKNRYDLIIIELYPYNINEEAFPYFKESTIKSK